MNDQKYWKKDKKILEKAKDLSWNFPEKKTGELTIIGGNSTNFITEIKTAEFLIKNYPFINTVKNIFPDSLKSKIPPVENITFLESTDSGSFKRSPELRTSLDSSDFCLFLGDFSKNSETILAIIDLIKNTKKPILLTRDTIDVISNDPTDIIEKENLTLLASLSQLQTLLRSLYYPKVLLLSQPLPQTLETLHKFTLSYPVSITTFHEGMIISATSGNIITTDISSTNYSPLSLWSGELAGKISVFSMFNASSPLESMLAAIN